MGIIRLPRRGFDKGRLITNLKQFAKIMLKTGEVAYIVDILDHSYVCDIERQNGTDTDFVNPNEIAGAG